MRVFENLPPASPRLGFYKTVSAWKDAALLEFGPEGTMHYAQGTVKGDTGNLYTTGMKEPQIIFGDTKNLEKAIFDIDTLRKPNILFVLSSPVSEIIGTDLQMICRKLQPSVHAALTPWNQLPVEGFQSQGSSYAYQNAADYLRRTANSQITEDQTADDLDSFLILGLTEADWNGLADLAELRRMMHEYFHLSCLNDPDGRYRLSDLRKARVILAATPEAVSLAAAAKELWDIPWCESLPYGLNACERLITELETILSRPADHKWNAERKETMQMRLTFQKSLSSLPHRQIFLDTDKSRHAYWKAFLSAELGLTVIVPAAADPGLSGDGSLDYIPGLSESDIIVGSGLLCSLYPEHTSLCVTYPVTQQKVFSRHLPYAGLYGTQNLLTILYSLLMQP